MQFNFSSDQILAALMPRTGDPILLTIDIMLYIMFFLNLIAFFMQDDKQLPATLLMGSAIGFVVVSKLQVFGAKHLAMLLINAGIFVVPLLVTGMSKAKKTKPITIISGVIGGFYFFMYWFFLQRP